MERKEALKKWLAAQHPDRPFTLKHLAQDADFRRYFRADFADGATLVCMDADPEKINLDAYINVRNLFAPALNVPQIFDCDKTQGFMTLSDLGDTQLLKAMQDPQGTHHTPEAQRQLLLQAADELVLLQKTSRPDVLPEYGRSELLREINLFPDWFVAIEVLGRNPEQVVRKHDPLCQDQAQLGEAARPVFNTRQAELWQQGLNALLPVIENQPKVFVHRDFIVRNLMLTPERIGVLDFQDALYGPIAYDLVSLLRDAFIEWEEALVLDIAIRYWEKARAAALPVPATFDEFYRWFEFTGVQRHLKVAGIFTRLRHRDHKDKYYPEIPRFLNYLRRTTRRYGELRPLYDVLVSLAGDDDVQTGYTF
ncbi:aminoglycoside phosphotransferase family protein [Conchiformibius kuhniae]|uniref:Aminoglycoside phosphotransferase family protein n=1 Tax=Conchiformibius kuhniae TaxID=211502 RepID=A0A8T9MWU5_9NEIS|nr:phosphotransferase [Conchiformibius kuhniae]